MGHIRLGELPRSKKWQAVVQLLTADAGLSEIASASAEAAEQWLAKASSDQTLSHAFWLLTQLPQAARYGNFSERLWQLGLHVSDAPSLLDIGTALAQSIDVKSAASRERTDLGEIAQQAAIETILSLAGRELPSLFSPTAAEVQQAIGKYATSSNFSVLARDFFARVTRRSLAYFLSRELSNHIGPGARFASSAERSEFDAALDLHCRQASRIIKEFASGWYGKQNSQGGQIAPGDASRFANVAFRKLRSELRRGSASDA
ncbi:MAG TPA: hypothetical protein VGN80_12470 [Devosiaceae bacterium]|jgi:hypothetical protein|nr:hypothetical protein [Devosiaceae bacterium]